MLKLKYFKFEQEKEMNEFLEENNIKAGSSVFVDRSGQILIPYDDGRKSSGKLEINRLMALIVAEDLKYKSVEEECEALMVDITLMNEDIAKMEGKLVPNLSPKENKKVNREALEKINHVKNVVGQMQSTYDINLGTLHLKEVKTKVYEERIKLEEEKIKKGK